MIFVPCLHVPPPPLTFSVQNLVKYCQFVWLKAMRGRGAAQFLLPLPPHGEVGQGGEGFAIKAE